MSGREERVQAKRVLAEGTATRAIVQSIQPTNATLGDEPIVLLELDVMMPEGETKRVTVRTAIYTVHIPQYQPGCEIGVRYSEGPLGPTVVVEGAYLP